MKVQDKVIVVTGAASGIGKALVEELLEKGATVAAVDRSEDGLQTLRAMFGEEASLSTHEVDLADRKAIQELPKKILSVHGSVDGIINNAGIIQPFVKIEALDEGASEQVMNVNFYGTLRMVKAFLPELHKRPEAHIVNVSSMGGFLPVPGQSVYGASKAAVKLLTEALYAELQDTNIGVTVVLPGATETNITQNSGVEAPKIDTKKLSMKALPARKAAELIIGGMEKNQFQVFTGSDSKFMNRLYRFSPRFATRFIAKQMKSLLS